MRWVSTPMLAAANGALFVILSLACAEAADEKPTPLTFRRLYVPADALDSQIRGLLPMKRSEFERRIGLIQEAGKKVPGQTAARIEEATFRARFDGRQLNGGSAELSFVKIGSEPTLAALEPCNLALEAAAWIAPQRRAAFTGIDASGQLRCLVEQSGTLELKWHQAAAESPASQTTFELRLPPALRRRLEIEASDDVKFEISAGLLVSSDKLRGNDHQRLWIFDLSGGPQVELRVKSSISPSELTPQVIVRESTTYNVIRSSFDVESTLSLDVLGPALERLQLQADAALEITAVRLGEQSLSFSATPAADAKHTLIAVELPAELSGVDRTLEITAVGDWPGTGSWSLPRIGVRGAELQEARTTLTSPAWMRLQARPLGAGAQTSVAAAPTSRGLDRFEFQLFHSGATIEITPSGASAPLLESSATQITVEGNQVTGVLTAELTSLGASRFALEAQVPPHWIIDAVETQPPEALADRTLVARGAGPHLLRLKLARPLTAQRPLRLVIRAHYRRPSNSERLGEAFFRVASFPEVRDGRRLVSVRVNDPSAELHLTGDDNLERLEADRLTPAEQRLFEMTPGPLLFAVGATTEALSATLQAASPRYRAEVLVVADASANAINQSIAIHCQPEASGVGSLLVRLSPRPPADVTWRLLGSEPRELPAALETLAPGEKADEALYRLLLPRTQNAAFDVRGQWSTPHNSAGEITLAWLPESNRQIGIAEIHSSHGGLHVHPSDVQALPQPLAIDQHSLTLLGRYRYDGGRRAQIAYEIAPLENTPPPAWIEMLELHSHHSVGGGLHEATFTIRNSGAREFQVRLPTTAHDCRLLNDQAEEQVIATSPASGEMTVPLDPLRQLSVVKIRYSSTAQPSRHWPITRIITPIPQPSLPVLGRQWAVSLAPGLALPRPAGDWPIQRIALDRAASPAAADNFHPAHFSSLARALAGPALAVRLGLFSEPPGESSIDSAFPGWRVARLDLPADLEAELVVYRPASTAAWAFCLALAAVAMVLRLAKMRHWLTMSAGILAAIAIGVPPPVGWLSAGLCLGVIVGIVLQLFLASREAGSPAFSGFAPRSTAILPTPAGAALLPFLLFSLGSHLIAAPQPPGRSASAHPHVILPVDEDMQPSGDYVFLDPDFYADLHRLTQTSAASEPNCLLESARLELPAAPTLRGAAAAVDEMRVTFDFQSFQPDTMVKLPLRRDQVTLLEGRSRLDGQPTTLAWQADGMCLLVQVAAAGKHRLTLALAASATRSDDHLSLDVDIPLTAFFTAEALPGIGSSPIVSSRRGATANHLKIHWPSAGLIAAPTAILQGEQLHWWQIQPGSVVLQGRYRLTSTGRPIHEAAIEVDPRLRVLPGLAGGRIRRVWTDESQANTVKVEFVEPAADVQFRLAWLWPDVSGLGKLPLPEAKLQADRLFRNWTAISADDTLKIISSHTAAAAATPLEFSQNWGESKAPQLVLPESRLIGQHPIIEIQLDEPLPKVEQTIAWSISNAAAHLVLSATFKDLPTVRFEERLALPPQLKVSRVSATRAGRVIAIRWTQAADGLLVMSRMEPPAAEETWTITGELVLPPARNRPGISLPALGLQRAELTTSLARIYRHADVELRLAKADGWSLDESANAGSEPADLGHLAATLVNNPVTSSKPLLVTRIRNAPRLAGTMLIRTDEADGDWRCEANLDMHISGGVLDVLRLTIPDDWAGPLEIEPPMDYRLEAAASAPRRQLVLRPRQPLSGHARLIVRGQLSGGGSGIRAPDIEVVGGPNIERLVLLDRGSAGHRIDWDTTGLSPASSEAIAGLPPEWRGAPGELFRATGPRFDATAHIRQTTSSSPRIHLADVRVILLPARRAVLHAVMTVHPASARQASFALPPGYRLVQALIDDLPAPCVAQGLRTWQVAAPAVMPYRLTIVCDTALPAGHAAGTSLRLESPQLVGMDVQKTLWSVMSSPRAPGERLTTITMPQHATGPPQPCTPAEAGLARMEAAAQALEEVAGAYTANVPLAVIGESYQRWHREFDIAKATLDQLLAESESTDNFRRRRQVAEDTATKVKQRLLQAAVASDATVPPPGRATLDGSADLFVVGDGHIDELTLSIRPDTQTAPSRGEIAWGLTLCSIAFGLLMAWPPGRDWIVENGRFLLAACGVAWWLMAPIGWLGWLLVAGALWLTLRPTAAPYRTEAGSTLQRFAPSHSR